MANVTRGSGLLENALARRRHRQAARLLPEPLRGGALLDLGCGRVPLFLQQSGFAERVGLEKGIDYGQAASDDLRLIEFDLQREQRLPFGDGTFAAATMLAVIEHLPPACALALAGDVRRVLRPGGVFVLTTPAAATAGLLRLMAGLRLLSRVEIDSHQSAYTPRSLCRLLQEAGFPARAVRTGHFEMGLNLWAQAVRSDG